MPLKDLSGKDIYDLEQEDFEKLFCQYCHEYKGCPRDEKRILSCKLLVDSGVYDNYMRKRQVR